MGAHELNLSPHTWQNRGKITKPPAKNHSAEGKIHSNCGIALQRVLAAISNDG